MVALVSKRVKSRCRQIRAEATDSAVINTIRSAFAIVDRKRDGRVDADELKQLLKALQIPIGDAIVDQLIAETSARGDGSITELEFFRWMLQMDAHEDDLEGELRAAFRVFDIDRNNDITREELHRAMKMMGEEMSDDEIDYILKTGDVDQDGVWSYEEFIRALLK